MLLYGETDVKVWLFINLQRVVAREISAIKLVYTVNSSAFGTLNKALRE